MSDREATKYGSEIEDHDWSKPDVETPERTSIKNHEVDVIYTVDPDADMGYGRKKYTATIRYDDETEAPYVLYVVEHKWKGNYWRDVTDWDYRDIPKPVKEAIAAKLPVDGPDTLQTEPRLMDEGGESRWQKHHKPRMESMSGDEMWGTSFLRDAVNNMESAAEAFDDNSTGEKLTEKLISVAQKTVKSIEANDA